MTRTIARDIWDVGRLSRDPLAPSVTLIVYRGRRCRRRPCTKHRRDKWRSNPHPMPTDTERAIQGAVIFDALSRDGSNNAGSAQARMTCTAWRREPDSEANLAKA